MKYVVRQQRELMIVLFYCILFFHSLLVFWYSRIVVEFLRRYITSCSHECMTCYITACSSHSSCGLALSAYPGLLCDVCCNAAWFASSL